MAPKSDAVSLMSFDEMAPKCNITSPRSLQACKLEGVLPSELAFKPPEAFAERSLSPRLVKLRYDFFEAKRRDLLAAARRARDGIVADESREQGKDNLHLELQAKESGLTKGAILALNGDTLRYERQKLLKAQEIERTWLQNALNNELKQLQKLEGDNKALTEEADKDAQGQRDKAKKLKDLNDKRAIEEEVKAQEGEARQKLEKQIAKEEFHKQQQELEVKAKKDAVKAKEAYERQVANSNAKLQREKDKEEKREQAAKDMEARKYELRAQDIRRQEVLEQQKGAYQTAMREKQDARDLKIFESMSKNQEIEDQRREAFDNKCKNDEVRDERLAQAKALAQEECAKNSFQLMMRRKVISDESTRKMEDRRSAILENQEETEVRLLEHEQKKERYLDFKRELDGLRSKNKEINVERQRRKEEAGREKTANDVEKKDQKIVCMRSERQRLWNIRRAAQTEAYRAREIVKSEIIRQRIASKFDSGKLTKQLSGLMNQDVFHPKVVEGSSSMPLLRRKGATEALTADSNAAD